MGYFYIVEFENKTKYGISDNSPKSRISSHCVDLRKLDLNDKIIHEYIYQGNNYKVIENKLKNFYGKEWVNDKFVDIFLKIQEDINIFSEEILLLDNDLEQQNINYGDIFIFLQENKENFYEKISTKDAYNLYDDYCLINDFVAFDFEKFEINIRKIILKDKLELWNYYRIKNSIFISYDEIDQNSVKSPVERFFQDMTVPFIDLDPTKTKTQQKRTSLKKLEELFKDWIQDQDGLGNVSSKYFKTADAFKKEVNEFAHKEEYVCKDKGGIFYFTNSFYDNFVSEKS